MKKQAVTALLLMAALITVSCGEQTVQPADTDAVADPVTTANEEEPVPELPERDFGGETFTFLNGNTSYTYGAVVIEEETGDAVNDALFRRNSRIAEQYNVVFEEIPSTSIRADALKSVQAGDNAYQIALMQVEHALAVTLENAAVDYADIPYLCTDREWWVRPTLETMSIDGHNYYGVSMFDITHFESTRALYFNKRMASELDLESPYDLVENGKWTLDKLREFGLAAIRDLNGDGAWTYDDCYGFSSWGNVGAPALMIGLNAPLSISKDKDDLPTFDMENEYYIDRLNKLTETLFCDEHYMIVKYTGDADFINGHCMFYSNLITSVVKMRDMTDDFGIITYPKYDEAQDRYYNYGGSPFYMIIPQTETDLERTGILIEALARASVGVTDSAYYDVLLQGKISRDEQSRAMLDLIFSTLSYQNPVAQQYVQTNLVDQTIWANNRDFASYFAANRELINQAIEETITSYQTGIGG